MPVVVALAWALLLAGEVGTIPLLDHDAAFAGDHDRWPAVGLLLLGWQVMVAAMMLPSSFPVLRDRTRHGDGVGDFLVGFGGAWAAFGCAILGFDALLHRVVDQVPWLSSRPYLVAAGVLAGFGAMQLGPSKARCLEACRRWTAPAHGAARDAGSFLAGARYGQVCLRCDGALMLAMFATGARTIWMAALGIAMLVERIGWPTPSVHRWTGAAVLGAAAATVAAGLS